MPKSSPETQTKPKRRLDPYWLFVVLFLLIVAAVFYSRPPLLQSLRALAFDTYQRIAPAKPLPQSPIRVVDIDEASLAHLGQWPWPRSTMAELNNKLRDSGASAIAYDVLFSEPDRTSPEQLLPQLPQERQAALRRVIANWQTHDAEFADSLAHSPSVLAVSFQNETTRGGFPLKAGMAFAGDNPAPLLPSFAGVSTSLPVLSDAAQGAGFINWLPDNDQIVRRVPLFARQGDTVAPSLALEALRIAIGASTYVIRGSNSQASNAFGQHTGMSDVRIGPATIPTDGQGQIWLHFRHATPQENISAWRVISGDVDPATFRDNIVLVGASAPGLLDLRATPLDAAIPGVAIHEQVLEQILGGHYLKRPDFAPAAEFLTALIAILVLAFAAPKVPASINALIGLICIAAICTGGVLLFVYAGYLFDPVFPSACAFVFSASSATYLYRRTEHQRAEIRRAFSQYVSPTVVHQLAAHPERLKLGGEVRELTVLVCDIRSFTTIAEGLNAEQLTHFINSFLSPLTDIIIENQGTVDKYMGDAIMAFWNAPLDDARHAAHACAASLQMMRKMRDLNDGWRAEAQAAGRIFKDVAIGIGLNSGECCVGNLGSDRRFDYSAIGDTVNITSRLEGLTKTHKLTLLVGEDTATLASGLPFLEVDLVRLKGRTTPSRVFTLLADAAPDEAFARAHGTFISAYREGRWDDAEALLAKARSSAPSVFETLYSNYQSRIAQLQAAAPTQWDGVFDLEEK
jgi:adenylate cyclase